MDHPSEHHHGLTLSLTWNAGARKKTLELPLSAALRVAAVLGLCAASFQFGVWRARLEQDAMAVAAAPMNSAPLARVEPISEQRIGDEAPGQPAGQPQEVITPLNVRDPSALVMGPSVGDQQPAAPPVPRRRRR